MRALVRTGGGGLAKSVKERKKGGGLKNYCFRALDGPNRKACVVVQVVSGERVLKKCFVAMSTKIQPSLTCSQNLLLVSFC